MKTASVWRDCAFEDEKSSKFIMLKILAQLNPMQILAIAGYFKNINTISSPLEEWKKCHWLGATNGSKGYRDW
ncbi:hypothetical protein [Coleofasciculus chthonoplastes]|nr:hypothetical protein [Coleofasciculus chthonoplastes]